MRTDVPRPQTQRAQAAVAKAEGHEGVGGHPGPRTYVLVAAWLFVATAIEVGMYYLKMPAGLFIGLLLFLMIVKFTTVVAYFMHLKYDAKIFRRFMVTGIVLAIAVYMIVLLTFGLFRASAHGAA
jgi:cytochrome c oxidase subunit 4